MKFRKRPLLVILLPLLWVSGTLRADQDADAKARGEFQLAYAAAELGQPMTGTADSERLLAYPLYPYLHALRLRRELANIPMVADIDSRIADVLSAQGDALSARELRRDWLLSLATRGVWATYLAHYPEGTTDATLRCHQLAARIALGRLENLLPAVIEQWLGADKSLPACDTAVNWLRAQGGLTPVLIEQRVRLILATGNATQARAIAATLPAETAAPLLQWAALIENPQHEIDALIAQPARAVERDALLDGWTRFARKDADAAASRFEALLAARKLDGASASPFARAVALGLAWSRKPLALDYFKRVSSADLDPSSAEWWARSALWAGDWPQATQVIAAMPESLRTQQRWRYWAARGAVAQNDPAAAAQFEILAGEDGWYPVLASAQLHRAYAPHPKPLASDPVAHAQLAALPALVRAHELFLCALRTQASAEWNQGLSTLDAAGRTQAISLAHAWGLYDQAVGTASQQMIFTDYALLYPRPYDPQVKVGAALSGLSGDLIYGVLRQESLYRTDALSKANAMGLMQLLRETAALTAKRAQRPVPSGDALFDPDVNVPLGSAHLRELVDRFDGQLPLAIAAYNAGPNAVPRWLPPAPMAADIWIENIPYNETRIYVQRVLWHSMVFGWRRTGKAQKVDGWIAPISSGVREAVATDTAIPLAGSPSSPSLLPKGEGSDTK